MKSLFIALILTFTSLSLAQDTLPTFTSKGMRVSTEKILNNSGDTIWSMAFIDKDTMVFTEKGGKIKTLNLKSGKTAEIKNPPKSHVWGQGGLLDIHLHPEFKSNKVLFLSFTKKIADKYTTAVVTAKLDNGALKEHKEIFVANNPSREAQHFGSRFAHDEKGYLYFTVGDRGERDLAQKLNSDQGKLHRLKLDGSVPDDNPFTKTKGAQKTIWSLGHRNPQGLAFDFETKTLWLQEHGPRGGDEINRIEKGLNYGWPIITYGKEYWGPTIGAKEKKGLEQPTFHYTPSIAPSGFAVYRGKAFPNWNGDLLSGALKLTHLNRLEMSSTQKPIKEERLLEDLEERIRDVRQGPDDLIYLSTDSGNIYRLKPIKVN